ncbi:hypothetical protein KIW84_055110 [Lathyrus oleraceus]|uniref:DUF7745 domain-containing protein n=1 Tax=Pisum sativum TaxID=3888 RepID=A0A9D4WUW6_PEA|nr:hypothetical protein KIW84_055110 [Pisum sativum]
METNKRTTFYIKETMPDLQSLKVLQGMMSNSIQRKFTLKYGGILDLLRVLVKVEVVTALGQFYDPPLLCLLFQYFLLALTLEEFGLYLYIPKDRKGPYMGMGKKVKPKNLAMTLGMPTEDLLSHYKEDRDIQGIKRSYLEGVARRMDGDERWGSYVDILDLIMLGIILFPNVVNFVDVSAINIFWVVKNLEVDLVPTLLVDVYYTMRIFHNREKGSLRCCIPLSYQWFSSHLYKNIHMIEIKSLCPSMKDQSYDTPNPIPVSIQEVDNLKSTIVRLEQDNESLEHSLYDATYEKNQISYDLQQKDKQLLENMEELHI